MKEHQWYFTMNLMISLCVEPNKIVGTNRCFVIYDTNLKKITNLLEFDKIPNVTRGTGMCYSKDHWYGIFLAKEHRVGSKLVVINLRTGKKQINNLQFSKAVHSICYFGNCKHYTMLLANSTQNDTITIITLNNTRVITEDLYFDYLNNEERIKLNWCKEYEDDDFLHNNDVVNHKGTIYTSMFFDYQSSNIGKMNKKSRKLNAWRENSSEGAIYNLTKQTLMYKQANMPHSILWDSRGDMLFCDSGNYSLVNVQRNTSATLEGFTRGLCEDKKNKGYWVGLSSHRLFSTAIDCAKIQFVSYDMELGECLSLTNYKEIYDVIPQIKGRYY